MPHRWETAVARFWLFSDLHQEHGENAWTPVRPDVLYDAILVAGDVHSPLESALGWLRSSFPSDRIVYVAGNQDYWQDGVGDGRLAMDEIDRRAGPIADFLGIHLLLDGMVEIAGARVIGSTLWTDFAVGGHWSPRSAMHAAQKGMNDYRYIRRESSTRPTKPIRHEDLLRRHRASVEFLDTEMSIPFDGPTVVVTHHAPHPRSLIDQHDELSGCYASDLTWLIRKHAPDAWVHGHCHVPSDYMVGDTRIVCNPRGYRSEAIQRRWDPAVIVEV